ncbi:unnamed protein product [Linum tenue]|uniref:CCHC-type domain-containing protein n=1 Tax=Linum tenue TaxID=586396 RepID=A0AAV0H5V2_9ROSI|nr:unnamed protein product [Linum tenue]
MIVWVQLPALKVHFYHKEVLITLSNLIGHTIKLDFHTLNRQRAKFARLAVEVDLGKHLVPRIWLDEEWQKVEYENLPTVCFECGKIGHMSTECPQLLPPVAPAIGWASGGAATASTPAKEPEEHLGFGPWMLVSRKSRRDPRVGTGKGKSNLGNGGVIPTPMIKKGKEGAISKETDHHANSSKSSHISKPQEGKGGNGKKSGEEVRKGKEKAVFIPARTDKGLLGPGPNNQNMAGLGVKPTKASNIASSSTNPISPQGPSKSGPLKSGETARSSAPKPASATSSIPQPIHVISGPNRTTMHIMEVQSPE